MALNVQKNTSLMSVNNSFYRYAFILVEVGKSRLKGGSFSDSGHLKNSNLCGSFYTTEKAQEG